MKKKKDKRKKMSRGYKNYEKKIPDSERLVLGLLYEEGSKVVDLCKKYDISKVSLYKILREPDVIKMREAIKQASIDRLWIAYERNAAKIDKIMDKYINEAVSDTRIKKTDLPGLFKVFDKIIHNKVKLKELALREHEVDLKQKLIDNNPEPDTGMIKDLLMVLDNNNANLLNKFKYTNEEDKDEEEDIDEDIKKHSNVYKKKEKAKALSKKHFGKK